MMTSIKFIEQNLKILWIMIQHISQYMVQNTMLKMHML